MARYHVTKKAVADLADIWNYTFTTWSEKQADIYYKMLLDTCEELAAKPTVGKSYEEVLPGLFGKRAGSHLIFYRIVLEEIEVLRFLHSKMDLRGKMED